jgi:metal-responsive CopG/Arc/MetJ family transcriptional regulator
MSHSLSMYKQFVICLPEHLAAQINTICEKYGLSYSDFFCEAAFAYLAAKSKLLELQYVTTIGEEEVLDNPFHVFGEWNSKADSVYDTLR